MNKFAKSLGLVLVLGASIAMAGTQGYTFKPTYKKGDVVKHRFKANFAVMGMEANVSNISVVKVLDVSDNGDITFESTSEENKTIVNGQEMDQGLPGSIYVTDKDGNIKKFQTEASPEAYRTTAMLKFHAPDSPKKVGDKWTVEKKGDTNTGAVAFKVDNEVVAEETVDGEDCVKVKYVFKETEGSEPASHTATVWMRKSDFALVKGEGKLEGMPIAGAGLSVTGSYTLSLIK